MRSAIHITVIFGCLLAWGDDPPATISTAIDIHSDDLLAQPLAGNWLSYNGDYSGRRYSSLSEISKNERAQMREAGVFHVTNTRPLEVPPVAANGMMFVTASNDAFALDARSGRVV